MKYKPYYWWLLKPFIKKYLKKYFDKRTIKSIFKKSKIEYKNLLSKADDIGFDNPMASNIYLSLLFVSFLTANRDNFTKEMLEEMMESLFSNLAFIKRFIRFDLNNEKDMNKLKKRILRNSDWEKKNRDKYPETWDFNFENKHKDGCYYYFTKCPINKFFRDNHLEDLTYIFCDTDYISFKMGKGRLIRDCTLANGDDICDFWIVGDKVENPK